jgi:hypothetical protein
MVFSALQMLLRKKYDNITHSRRIARKSGLARFSLWSVHKNVCYGTENIKDPV